MIERTGMASASSYTDGVGNHGAEEQRFRRGSAINLTMRREDFGSVKVGQTVWVHEPNPPTYGLFEGQVTGTPYPDVLRIYLPDRGENVSPDLARIHLNEPDEAERARCHWCKEARA